MLPLDARRDGDRRRARRRSDTLAPEVLEGRQLLAYTPLGYSLPDLSVMGFTAPVAAYGGPLAVTVDVQNLGASSLTEPLALQPGATSSADVAAGQAQVVVYLSSRPRLGPGAIPVATVDLPAIPQNSLQELTTTITMPPQLPGLPGSGGTVYAFFRVRSNPSSGYQDLDPTNNTARVGVPFQIAAPLPDLQPVLLAAPSPLYGGDTFYPVIKVANLGTVDTQPQGPVIVDLVASTDTNFGPGDVVLAQYSIANIPPLSEVPLQRTVLGDVSITDPVNIHTLNGPLVVLPDSTIPYYIGVIADPLNTISEIREIGTGPSSALSLVRPVSPSVPGVPAAVSVTNPASPANLFPFPPFGQINTPGSQAVSPILTISSVSDAEALSSFVTTQALAARFGPTGNAGGSHRGPLANHRAAGHSAAVPRVVARFRQRQAAQGKANPLG